MVSLIEEYVERCSEAISGKADAVQGALVGEIVSVFVGQIPTIKTGLDRYKARAIVPGLEIKYDNIGDLQKLKGKLLLELENQARDRADHVIECASPQNESNSESVSSVFIVHGHDGELKESIARLVERQGLRAVILHEQANQGQTIIEKFERNSDVNVAICIFTADDFGRAKDSNEDSPRARQNVVFETGYFIGKLGRDKVVIVADRDVEIPSDMSGIVYSDTNNLQFDVLTELIAAGLEIDFNRFLR